MINYVGFEIVNIKDFIRKEKGKNQYTTYQSGVTLVALVITLIILLILAGVTITSLVGNNGIIKKAQEAVNVTNEEIQSEQEEIDNLREEFNSFMTENGTEDNPGGNIPPIQIPEVGVKSLYPEEFEIEYPTEEEVYQMFEDFYTNYFSEFEAELENKELISKVFATKPIDPARNAEELYELRLSFNGLTENMEDIMVLYYDLEMGTFFLESPTIV